MAASAWRRSCSRPPTPGVRLVCQNDGPDVSLFVDHSQIVKLECLRRGIRGTKSPWGRVVAYGGPGEKGAAVVINPSMGDVL
jgi:hypothetical protein